MASPAAYYAAVPLLLAAALLLPLLFDLATFTDAARSLTSTRSLNAKEYRNDCPTLAYDDMNSLDLEGQDLSHCEWYQSPLGPASRSRHHATLDGPDSRRPLDNALQPTSSSLSPPTLTMRSPPAFDHLLGYPHCLHHHSFATNSSAAQLVIDCTRPHSPTLKTFHSLIHSYLYYYPCSGDFSMYQTDVYNFKDNFGDLVNLFVSGMVG